MSVETLTVEQASKQALKWCARNPGWVRICDLANSDSLYETWADLTEKEKEGWRYLYGNSAKEAWQEFGVARCKVPLGFISGKGEFYKRYLDIPNYHQGMMIFKVGGDYDNKS